MTTKVYQQRKLSIKVSPFFPGGGGLGYIPLLSSCSLVVGPGLRLALDTRESTKSTLNCSQLNRLLRTSRLEIHRYLGTTGCRIVPLEHIV